MAIQAQIADSEEKILADLSALVRRAINFGRTQERDSLLTRVYGAINDEKPENRVAKPALPAPGSVRAPRGMASYPYGYVKKAVGIALGRNLDGLDRKEIAAYAARKLDTPLSDSAIQTALRTLSKAEDAEFRDKKWYPTNRLIQEVKKQDALE